MVWANLAADTCRVITTPETFSEIIRYLPFQLGIDPAAPSETRSREARVRDRKYKPSFRTQNARYGVQASSNVIYILNAMLQTTPSNAALSNRPRVLASSSR
jgi:hypothetical protein